jgi:hypothetical protein
MLLTSKSPVPLTYGCMINRVFATFILMLGTGSYPKVIMTGSNMRLIMSALSTGASAAIPKSGVSLCK